MAGASEFLRLSESAHLPSHLRGGVIAIGNFDGVHCGHRAVLDEALAAAGQTGKPAIVFTFEPHPRSLFKPEAPLFRLSSAAQKAAAFAALGFSAVIEQDFTPAFAALSAEDFVRRILIGDLAAACVVAGANFHFGHKRGGTPDFLRRAGQEYGFAVKLIPGQSDGGGALISSSRIRALLAEGNVAAAGRLLGHFYAVKGEIIHGQKLGRTLGFPTANMALPAANGLKYGIYAVYFRAKGRLYQGVASFGRRPTVEAAGRPLLETYLFDFSGDIYGEQAEVLFIGFLRGEEKFASIEALTAQMHKDAAAAKALLAQTPPPAEE